MNQTQEFTFSENAQLIECKIHKQLLISLNITPNLKLRQRLVCKKCQIFNQSLLSFDEVQVHLQKLYEEEQQQLQLIQTTVDTKLEELQNQLDEQKRFFEYYFNQVGIQIRLYGENFREALGRYSQTKLKQIIESLSQTPLSSEILSNAANFLSQQKFEQDKLLLSTQHVVSDIEDEFFLNQFKTIESNIELYECLQTLNKKLQKIEMLNDIKQPSSQLNYNDFKELEGHDKPIGAVAVSKDNQLVASGDKDGLLIVWQIPSMEKRIEYKADCQIQDLNFSCNNALLAVALSGSPYDILVFDISKTDVSSPNSILQGHTGKIKRIIFDFQSQYLISGSSDKTVKIWNLSNSKIIYEQSFPTWIFCIAMSYSEKYLSVCSDNGKLYLFDCHEKIKLNQLVKWQAHEDTVYGTAFTPDSKIVLTCNIWINLWSVRELIQNDHKMPLKVIQGMCSIWRLCIPIKGQYLVINDNQIKIWDLKNSELVCQLKVSNKYQYVNEKNFGVTSDMKYIITGGQNNKLKLYELNQE